MGSARLSTVRAFLPYAAIPLLGGLAPLMVIPAITSMMGASTWASVAVAQSIGAGVAVIVELGWGVTGPQLVAASSERRRRQVFAASVYSKTPTVLTGAAAAAALAAFLVPSRADPVMMLVAAGTTFTAFQQNWFFIGARTPGRALTTDTWMRVGASAISAGALAMGAPLLVYAIAMLLQPLLSLALASRAVRPEWATPRRAVSIAAASIREQGVVTLGRSIGGLYTALPIAIVSIAAPASVAEFSALERMMRMGLSALSAVPQSLQGWIGASLGAERARRARRALALNGALGIVAGSAFFVIGRPLVHVLFTGEIRVDQASVAAFAVVVTLVCTSRGAGLALVAVGGANSITLATALSAVVGVPGIYVLSATHGATGGALGEIAAESVGLAVQLVLLGTRLRGDRWTDPRPSVKAGSDLRRRDDEFA
jgi:O-antigen/teichoic acid export membrane protein